MSQSGLPADASDPRRLSSEGEAFPVSFALALVDADNTISWAGEWAERLLGHPPQEVVGRPVAALIGDTDSVLRHRDGRRLPFRPHLIQLPEHMARGGRLLAAVPTREVAGTDTGALIEAAFEQYPTAYALYDTEARLLRLNTEMARVLARSEEDLRGIHIGDIEHTREYAEADIRVRRVAKTGEPEIMEPFTKVPGESEAHLWSSEIFPLKDDSGKVRAVGANAQDLTELHRGRERLALFTEARTRIGVSLEVDGTARELTHVAVPRFADYACVDLLGAVLGGDLPGPVEEGTATLHRAVSASAYVPSTVPDGSAHSHLALSPVNLCLTSGRALRFSRTDPEIRRWLAGDPAGAALPENHGAHSFIVVPIRARGATLGVVSFTRHSTSPGPFSPDDLLVAEDLVAQTAVCLDNSRRYTRERNIASSLQRRELSPRARAQPAVDVAARYLSARGGSGPGGGWFDVIPLPGLRVGLVVGTVVGHGIRAAAAASRLRMAVRTLAEIELAPDEVLTRLDDIVSHAREGTRIAGDAVSDIGATCLYAVYDPASQVCTLARAGHPAPVLIRPGARGEVVSLPSNSPLGTGGLPFEGAQVTLPPDSVLALFDRNLGRNGNTVDGDTVEEAPAGLMRAFNDRTESLDEICESIVDLVRPEEPTDDIALLVARTHALDSDRTASWDLPCDPSVVAEARQNACGLLTAWGLEDLAFVTELVVSELVTNAIRYGVGPIRLRLLKDKALICEVSDGGDTSPHVRRAKPTDEGGRGLLLVAQLSERWGTRMTAVGKTVWAEQSIPPDQAR
ncbi:SpoIIE family protein phosphatase [Streptomyces sp. NPDC058665]|uniref:SpoIIE family protein phosphatase n=1 Tax=Streptomyces sp. NPDC058665 TaxID=3346586 RepID=UPI00365C31AA